MKKPLNRPVTGDLVAVALMAAPRGPGPMGGRREEE